MDAPDDEPPEERLLDWEQDAAAIWADFKLYYRNDLRRARMHWWDFLALLRLCPKGSVIRGRMSLRAVKLGEIKDPETRAEYARRKARVRLDGDAPDMDDFMRILQRKKAAPVWSGWTAMGFYGGLHTHFAAFPEV